MSKNRYSARADENQPAIVKELRALGLTVQTNMDDILIGYKGSTFWIEIKDPAKELKQDGTLKAGALKPSQEKLLTEWKGHYAVCWTTEMILKSIGYIGQ